MSAFTRHAEQRIADRLTDVPTEARSIAVRRIVRYAEAHPSERHAVLALRDARTVRVVPWAEDSNGTDVWAIIEDGHVRTVMYRRPAQSPDRLGCKYVSDLTKERV